MSQQGVGRGQNMKNELQTEEFCSLLVENLGFNNWNTFELHSNWKHNEPLEGIMWG